MRLCPTVDGTHSPLITHQIGVDVCQTRQHAFYHKCHRCIYRGQAANWEPEAAPLAMDNVHAAEEPTGEGVRRVDVAAKAKPASRNGSVAPGLTAAAAKSPKVGKPSKNGAVPASVKPAVKPAAKPAAKKVAVANRSAEAGG